MSGNLSFLDKYGPGRAQLSLPGTKGVTTYHDANRQFGVCRETTPA